jgi:predicted transposase YdaD
MTNGRPGRYNPPMPLPFDATLKALVQSHPADFEAVFRLRGPGPPTVLNVDLATVSAATDVTLGYGDPPTLLVDLNFQAGRDADLPARVRLYNALLHHRLRAPVHSVVILLRPEADAATITGRLRYQALPRRGAVDFRYEVVRLWERPARRLLAGGPGTLPLAVLGRLPEGRSVEEGLAGVVAAIDRRLRRQTDPAESRRLLTAAFVLSGLRVEEELSQRVFRGVTAMRESTTYQAILREGRAEGIQQALLIQGRKRFGAPDVATQDAVKAVTDVAKLERMTERLLDVSTWQDLLATP